MNRLSANAALLVATAALASGCAADDPAARTDAAAAAPHEVHLTATNYAFQAPDTIPAGWTTFRLVNRGATMHAAQLVKLEEGRTLEEFLEVYGHAWRTAGPRPAWGRRIGGPGAAGPGESSNATMYLGPGSYAWYCPMNLEDGVPHMVGKGMAQPFVVQASGGATTPQVAPKHTVTVRLVDYAFVLSEPLTAGRHIIRVENLGPEPHELAFGKLAPGKTIKDLKRWLAQPEGPPPLGEGLGGVNALAAGAKAYFEVDLTPGDHVLLCFVTAPDGRPHIEHGMIQQVRVG